jgi:hypothetical protein
LNCEYGAVVVRRVVMVKHGNRAQTDAVANLNDVGSHALLPLVLNPGLMQFTF